MPYPGKDKEKRKVRRLVDVDVSHVSLVDNPANRTPFKFIKRDEIEKGNVPMHISLKNMFGSRAPEVTSVIADTQAKAVAVAKMMISGDAAEVTEQDGVFVVRKSGTKPENEQVLHMGKRVNVAYTVANLQKELSLYDMELTSFDDALKSQGFVPSLYVAIDALMASIQNIAMSDETKSPEDFRAGVNTAIADFQKYVDGLTSALPEKAFKFEKALVAVSPNGPTPLHFTPEGFGAEVYDAVFGDEAPKPQATMTDADEAAKDGAAEATTTDAATEGADEGKATEAAPAASTEAEPDKAKADAAPANLEELPKGTPETTGASQEEIMAAALEAVTKKVGEQLAAALKPLADRADATDAAIGKLTKAVGGSVATTPDADDDNVVQLTKADEMGGIPPLMDTAYAKRG